MSPQESTSEVKNSTQTFREKLPSESSEEIQPLSPRMNPQLSSSTNVQNQSIRSSVRKLVKIIPQDTTLIFSGTNIRQFLRRFHDAEELDGSEGFDMVRKVHFFTRKNSIKNAIQRMQGFIKKDWDLLKEEMIRKWVQDEDEENFSEQDLEDLVDDTLEKGGIKNEDSYKTFMSNFEVILSFLIENQVMRDEEDAREYLYEALSEELHAQFTREMSMKNALITTKNKLKILPKYSVLKTFIESELVSCSRKIHTRRFRRGRSPISRNSQPLEKDNEEEEVDNNSRTKIAVVQKDKNNKKLKEENEEINKKLEELTEQIKASTVLKQPAQNVTPSNPTYQSRPNVLSNSHVPYRRVQHTARAVKCYYCYQDTHSTNRCLTLTQDMNQGLLNRDGQNYFLPDNTFIPWVASRPIRDVVIGKAPAPNHQFQSHVQPQQQVPQPVMNQNAIPNPQQQPVQNVQSQPQVQDPHQNQSNMSRISDQTHQQPQPQYQIIKPIIQQPLEPSEEFQLSCAIIDDMWKAPELSSKIRYETDVGKRTKNSSGPQKKTRMTQDEEVVMFSDEERRTIAREIEESGKDKRTFQGPPATPEPWKKTILKKKVTIDKNAKDHDEELGELDELEDPEERKEAETIKKIKSFYERKAEKDFPKALPDVMKRIFDQKVDIKVGELTVLSPTVAEELKKIHLKKKSY